MAARMATPGGFRGRHFLAAPPPPLPEAPAAAAAFFASAASCLARMMAATSSLLLIVEFCFAPALRFAARSRSRSRWLPRVIGTDGRGPVHGGTEGGGGRK
eukprot:CAMPEP_0204549496 /NCGR_PEP_ID=MMETSP0661-20131031/24390_1 /ASSEMBLY_ACC=CAM_ASM_000606 /TAXON_ID=109239 /ORGANISM="Alexandrium margalefi, Strain AMGDE01CS-322" /LENGTH=100 /DNA_ID=CAMNT_0051556441 /DNA_START=35 /DNA_END=334 /DNA_ORIENTATION=-